MYFQIVKNKRTGRWHARIRPQPESWGGRYGDGNPRSLASAGYARREGPRARFSVTSVEVV
jgi:hypothetical protein